MNLQDKLDQLERQLEMAKANVNQLMGAITIVKELLKEQEALDSNEESKNDE